MEVLDVDESVEEGQAVREVAAEELVCDDPEEAAEDVDVVVELVLFAVDTDDDPADVELFIVDNVLGCKLVEFVET